MPASSPTELPVAHCKGFSAALNLRDCNRVTNACMAAAMVAVRCVRSALQHAAGQRPPLPARLMGTMH